MDYEITLSMEATPELVELIDSLSKGTGYTKGEVIRNAVVLLDIALLSLSKEESVSINVSKITGIVDEEDGWDLDDDR